MTKTGNVILSGKEKRNSRMLRTCLLFIGFYLFSKILVYAETEGDYQTSNNGNWGQTGRWQVFYNGAWRNLATEAAGPYQNVYPSNTSGVITIRHSIRVEQSRSANQLVIESTGRLTIVSPRVLTLVDDFAQVPLLINPGGYLENNGTLDLQSQLSLTPCEIYGTVENFFEIANSNASLLQFNEGSVYQHSIRNGGDVPLANWNLNSTCVIGGLNNNNSPTPGNLDQAFGNFTWNTPTMGTTSTFSLGGALQTVRGKLTFISTGNTPREVRLANGGPGYSLSVGGDFEIQGGLVTLTQNQNSSSTVRVGGNLIISGGNVTLAVSNNSPVNLHIKGALQKAGGILDRGTGTGSVTLLQYH